MSKEFRFKQFVIHQEDCTMKVNTDGILLGAWTDVNNKRNALDIGTGTGIIAMMIAQKSSAIYSCAIEIDETACLQASRNMAESVFSHRLFCYHQSVQEFAKHTTQKFDLIVSNPPYFSNGPVSLSQQKAKARHTVTLSQNDLLSSVRLLLTTDGHFDVIMPYSEGLKLIAIASSYDLNVVNMVEVKARPDKPVERLLIRMGLNDERPCLKESLILHQSERPNDYTKEMIALTQAFYIFM
jgi:tRNA1Val (adenine37-N6)-methyltransferase